MVLGVVLSVLAEYITTLGKLPHLGVENRVKLQPRGVVTEGLWARGKSSQCQVLGQNFSHECLTKTPNTASRSRSSLLHTLSLGCPMAWLAPAEDAASPVPGPSMSNEVHFLSLPGISRKTTAGPAPPEYPLTREHSPTLSSAAQHVPAQPDVHWHRLSARVPAKPGNSPLQSGGYSGVC